MDELIRNGVVFGGLLGVALLGWRTRWRLQLLAVAVAVGVPLGVGLDTLTGTLSAGVPVREALLLLCWVGFTRLAVGAGGPRLQGPAWLLAPLLGATVGDWGAALLLAPLARSPAQASRWVLGAMAGALAVGHGTAAVLVLSPGGSLLPLAIGLCFVAAPNGRLDHAGSLPVTGIVVAVAAGVLLVPALALSVLAVGCAALLTHAQRSPLAPLRRDAAVLGLAVGVVTLVRHAGVLHDLRWGLEFLAEAGGAFGTAAITLGAALVATIGGEFPLSLAAAGAVDTAIVLDFPQLVPALATGLALGGLGPLWLAGALRPALPRWGLGLLLGVSWTAWTLH